ncbi:protein S100-A5 isoform X2 [Myotis lucifugus]|uniref:protein S100-A5 isoform X2 n=1 Tax=Myotis lucifugus TaxID=59463 RepID=UPI0006D73A13|nr:protein S100-A5 isoform X2 [Myotis lucifugus]
MRVSQACSLAFLPVSLHPGANEGGGRGHRSSRGSLQEDSGPGEGLAITGAQTGDKDCITERLFPSVHVPVSCLPRKSWGCGQRRGEGRMSVFFLYHRRMQESSIDDLMKSLDKNSDQEIDFKEYSVFLTTLCMAYNDFFLEDRK